MILKHTITLFKKQNRDQFKEAIEDMYHENTKGNQTKRVGNTTFESFPEQIKNGISIWITQEHEVFIKNSIDNINDYSQYDNL